MSSSGGEGSFTKVAGSAHVFAEAINAAAAASEKLTAQLAKQEAQARAAKKAAEEAAESAERAEKAIERIGEGLAGIALSTEMAGVALKSMAHQVDQVQEQISNGNKEIQDLFAQIDAKATDSKVAIYLNGIVNQAKEGIITLEEAKRQIAEVFQGLQGINAAGSGFLGDLTNQALEFERLLQRLQDEMQQTKDDAKDLPDGGDAKEKERPQSSGGIGDGGGSGQVGSNTFNPRAPGPTNSSGVDAVGRFVSTTAAPEGMLDLIRMLQRGR